MSSVRARSFVGKLRHDLPRVPALAREWRLTRRRTDRGTLHDLAETGRVISQQTVSTAGAARVRAARLASGDRLASIAREVLSRATPTAGETTASQTRHLRAIDGVGRSHVVLICYACKPGAGSEEGVGWTWTQAAAGIADVTVLTHPFAAADIERAAIELDLPIDVHHVEPPRLLRPIATRRWGGFVYYVLWQWSAGRSLANLERSTRVDVVHHVTWASDSLPSALSRSSAPRRIWGPVGGSTRLSPSLYRFLSPRSRFEEVIRDVSNAAFRLVGGNFVARHATLVVALNGDVEANFARFDTPVVVEPNCALSPSELTGSETSSLVDPESGLRTAFFVGRLMGWKGPLLAIESLVHAPGWRLVVLGEGIEHDRAEALANELGVRDRVDFRGHIPRPEVLAAFRSADALLFPSFHDSAPWAVGEAASLGCPVVCLDLGGPPLLAGRNAHVVAAMPATTLAQRVGERLEGLDGRGEPEGRWHDARLGPLLAGWYGIELGRSDASVGSEPDQAGRSTPESNTTTPTLEQVTTT